MYILPIKINMNVWLLQVVRLLLAIITSCTYSLSSIDDEMIRRYENLIANRINTSNHYVLPTDYSEFKADVPSFPSKEFGSYAFVVIGAGATGSVVVNRISEIFPDAPILLLEAGTYGDNFTDIPIYGFQSHYSQYNYGFYTVPQKYFCQGMHNKQCSYPRGKGIGGSTLINDLVQVRGNINDFDKLGAENPGWSYKDVLPLFKKLENLTSARPDNDFTSADMNFHSQTGSVNVEFNGPFRQNPQVEAFVNAHLQLGINLTDFNAQQQLGVGAPQVCTARGRRDSAGEAFIQRPQIASRPNLTILTNAFVSRLLIDDRTKMATAVEFTHKGVLYTVNVSNEIILSAGVIGSPQILMLSGIGPKHHLQSLGIQCKCPLPVGQNFKDHVFFGVCINSNATESFHPLREYIRQYLLGDNWNAFSSRSSALSFHSINNTNSNPDFELEIVHSSNIPVSSMKILNMEHSTMQAQCGDNANIHSTFAIIIILLHAKSIGVVKLNSSNPFDFPLIDPNSLSDSNDEDIEIMYQGVQKVLKLLNMDAFRKINATYAGTKMEACKSLEMLSKDYWYCTIRQMASTAWHSVATCPMGSDSEAVVDHKLKVRGIKKLRIADASVIPFTMSNHPSATCMMIGEKMAQILQDEYKSNKYENIHRHIDL